MRVEEDNQSGTGEPGGGSGLDFAYVHQLNAADYQDLPIAVLALSNRPRNGLLRSGVRTVGQLLRMDYFSLHELPSLGPDSVRQIMAQLKDFAERERRCQAGQSLPSGLVSSLPADQAARLRERLRAFLMSEDGELAPGEPGFGEEGICQKIREAVEILGDRKLCLELLEAPEAAAAVAAGLRDHLTASEIALMLKEADKIIPWGISRRPLLPLAVLHRDLGGSRELAGLARSRDRMADLPALFLRVTREGGGEQMRLLFLSFMAWIDECLHAERAVMDGVRRLLGPRADDLEQIVKLKMVCGTAEETARQLGSPPDKVRSVLIQYAARFWEAWQFLRADPVLFLHVIHGGHFLVGFDELHRLCGDFAGFFREICRLSRKKMPEVIPFFYCRELDVLVVRRPGSGAPDPVLLESIAREIRDFYPRIADPRDIPALTDEAARRFSLEPKLAEDLFYLWFRRHHRGRCGEYYTRGRITGPDACAFILRQIFPLGYKIRNPQDKKRFGDCLEDMCAELELDPELKSRFEPVIERVGILCGPGSYMHPDHLHVEPEILEGIRDYISAAPQDYLEYTDIFHDLEDLLRGTVITDPWLLQGALQKYGCQYEQVRGYVRKTPDLNRQVAAEQFAEQLGYVSKEELGKRFASLRNEAAVQMLLARSLELFRYGSRGIVHGAVYDITDEDYASLRQLLSFWCGGKPLFSGMVYSHCLSACPEFLERNHLGDPRSLTGILLHMFRGEFCFRSREIGPLIQDAGAKEMTIRESFASRKSLLLGELADCCAGLGIAYRSHAEMAAVLLPDFAMKDDRSLVPWGSTGITEEMIPGICALAGDRVRDRGGFLALDLVEDFSFLPEAAVPWSRYLLLSVIRRGGTPGITMIRPSPRQGCGAVLTTGRYTGMSYSSLVLALLAEHREKEGLFATVDDLGAWLGDRGLIGCRIPGFVHTGDFVSGGGPGTRFSSGFPESALKDQGTVVSGGAPAEGDADQETFPGEAGTKLTTEPGKTAAVTEATAGSDPAGGDRVPSSPSVTEPGTELWETPNPGAEPEPQSVSELEPESESVPQSGSELELESEPEPKSGLGQEPDLHHKSPSGSGERGRVRADACSTVAESEDVCSAPGGDDSGAMPSDVDIGHADPGTGHRSPARKGRKSRGSAAGTGGGRSEPDQQLQMFSLFPDSPETEDDGGLQADLFPEEDPVESGEQEPELPFLSSVAADAGGGETEPETGETEPEAGRNEPEVVGYEPAAGEEISGSAAPGTADRADVIPGTETPDCPEEPASEGEGSVSVVDEGEGSASVADEAAPGSGIPGSCAVVDGADVPVTGVPVNGIAFSGSEDGSDGNESSRAGEETPGNAGSGSEESGGLQGEEQENTAPGANWELF